MAEAMKLLKDLNGRHIRLTPERQEHIETDHPEMSGQIDKIQETIKSPDAVVKSRTDPCDKKRCNIMGKEVKIWYDKEGDYLEVLFEKKAGYFRETENDAVMEKVDNRGNVIGFSILKVSALKAKSPLSVSLKNLAVA